MTRRFFALAILLISTGSVAQQSEERRLTIGIKIFPHIVAVDQGLDHKLDSSRMIRLYLLTETDTATATPILEQMKKNIKEINGHAVYIDIIDVDNLASADQATALFVTQPMSTHALNAIMAHAAERKILAFSPFTGDVEKGVTAGLFISSRIKPYFNVDSLKRTGIEIHEKLYRISKHYR